MASAACSVSRPLAWNMGAPRRRRRPGVIRRGEFDRPLAPRPEAKPFPPIPVEDDQGNTDQTEANDRQGIVGDPREYPDAAKKDDEQWHPYAAGRHPHEAEQVNPDFFIHRTPAFPRPAAGLTHVVRRTRAGTADGNTGTSLPRGAA